jgi:hypothetical protein
LARVAGLEGGALGGREGLLTVDRSREVTAVDGAEGSDQGLVYEAAQ